MTSRTLANVAGGTSLTPILMHSQTLLQIRHVIHQTMRTKRGEWPGMTRPERIRGGPAAVNPRSGRYFTPMIRSAFFQ